MVCYNFKLNSEKTKCNHKLLLLKKPNEYNEYVKTAVQTGMDRYIQIKRKLIPLNSQRKRTRGNASLAAIESPMNTNRFNI